MLFDKHSKQVSFPNLLIKITTHVDFKFALGGESLKFKPIAPFQNWLGAMFETWAKEDTIISDATPGGKDYYHINKGAFIRALPSFN